MLPQDMVPIVLDSVAVSGTISHAHEVGIVGIKFEEVVQNKCQKNTSWGKKQKLLFLHVIG